MELLPPAWAPQRTTPPLPPDEVHVWRVSAAQEGWAPGQWEETLGSAERARLNRFRFPDDARREAAGHGALRRLLGGYLVVSPSDLQFRAGPQGKPELPNAAGIKFNLAHSGDWVLLAFARDRNIGVDVECVRPIETERLAENVLVAEEQDEWRRWPEAQRREAFYRTWTLKEAYLKALGTGLSKSPRSFRIRIAPQTPPVLMWCADDTSAADRWELLSLELPPGYFAALAAEKRAVHLRTYTLEP